MFSVSLYVYPWAASASVNAIPGRVFELGCSSFRFRSIPIMARTDQVFANIGPIMRPYGPFFALFLPYFCPLLTMGCKTQLKTIEMM